MTHPAHPHLCGDDDELGVPFNTFETALKWLLYFQSVDNNQLKLNAERQKAFLKSLYLFRYMIVQNQQKST